MHESKKHEVAVERKEESIECALRGGGISQGSTERKREGRKGGVVVGGQLAAPAAPALCDSVEVDGANEKPKGT